MKFDLLRTAPPGFKVLAFDAGYATAREDMASDLVRAGLLAAEGLAAHAQVVDSYEGRGSTAIVEIANRRLVVRRFLPGGLLRRFRSSAFASASRPFAELFLYEHLRRLRFPTLSPVAAVARRIGRRYELELITEELDAARDLLSLLEDSELDRAHRTQVLEAAGRTVAHLHRAGIRHADMHLKNLLVQEDRGVRHRSRSLDAPSLPARGGQDRQSRQAVALHTARRLRYSPRLRVSTTDVMRFLRGYQEDREQRHGLFRACLRRFHLSLPLHRLGWFLEALLRRFPGSKAS